MYCEEGSVVAGEEGGCVCDDKKSVSLLMEAAPSIAWTFTFRLSMAMVNAQTQSVASTSTALAHIIKWNTRYDKPTNGIGVLSLACPSYEDIALDLRQRWLA